MERTGRTGNKDNPRNGIGVIACKADRNLFADPIRASSPRRLHKQAGQTTAPDPSPDHHSMLATREPSTDAIPDSTHFQPRLASQGSPESRPATLAHSLLGPVILQPGHFLPLCDAGRTNSGYRLLTKPALRHVDWERRLCPRPSHPAQFGTLSAFRRLTGEPK